MGALTRQVGTIGACWHPRSPNEEGVGSRLAACHALSLGLAESALVPRDGAPRSRSCSQSSEPVGCLVLNVTSQHQRTVAVVNLLTRSFFAEQTLNLALPAPSVLLSNLALFLAERQSMLICFVPSAQGTSGLVPALSV